MRLAGRRHPGSHRRRKKGATLPCGHAGHAGHHKGQRCLSLLTACGPVAIRRTSRNCLTCQIGGFPVDQELDLDRSLTQRAHRLAGLFGLEGFFVHAGRLLDESAGWSLAPETLPRLCHAEAARLRRDRAERLESASHLAATSDWEVQVDAGKINTPDGWRGVKCAAFARRERAEPCDSAGYEQRDLPAPSVRAVIAEVEPAEALGACCQVELMRRNRPVSEPMSLLGDGAEWIWTLGARRFDQAEPVLDLPRRRAPGRVGLGGLGLSAISDGPEWDGYWKTSTRRQN